MTGLGIRVYTDEDVDPSLAGQLRRLGYDVVSCHDIGNNNQALTDEWQLRYAAEQGRAIFVFNAADYVPLDHQWKSEEREHWGIIVAENSTPIGRLVQRTRRHLETYRPEHQYNVVLHLIR